MKPNPPRRTRAFTLIELITVIAIISILMGLLFPALGPARQSALRQEASTVVRNVVNASNNYKQDYGKYPPVAAALDSTDPNNAFMSFGDTSAGRCKADNNALLDVLRAIDRGANANHALNPKQTKYYEGRKATGGKLPREGFLDGSEFDTTKLGQLIDPWGAEYCFILETDSNEALNLGAFYSDLTDQANSVRFGAVGISLGKDGKLGGDGYAGKLRKEKSTEPSDDVVSWQ